MNIFQEAQVVRIVFFVIAGIALAALIAFAIAMAIKSKKNKKEVKYFEKKLHETRRNELLNKAIANYSKQKTRNFWLVKIIEINQLGRSEHFYNLNDSDVSIGRDFKSNTLCIFDEDIDLVQCKVGLHKEIPYFTNTSEKVETLFIMKKKYKRQSEKKHQMRAGESIRLFTLDSVQFGETTLEFYIYNNTDGIV